MIRSIVLDDDIRDSLKAYKGEYYHDINLSLRQSLSFDEMDPSIRKHIENIDKSMKKGDKDIIVYRGLKGFNNILEYYKNIDSEEIGVPRIIELGYCSVTKNLLVAESFTEKDGCCVLAFNLTPDIKRYDFMDEIEKEILIQRNIQLILESDEYTTIKKIKVYKAIIKPYNPPIITEKDMKALEDIDVSIDIEQKAQELYEELEDSSFGKIDLEDINMIVNEYKNWSEYTKKMVKNKLIELSNL